MGFFCARFTHVIIYATVEIQKQKFDNHVTYVNRLASAPKYSSQIEFLIDIYTCVKDFCHSRFFPQLCIVSSNKLRTLHVYGFPVLLEKKHYSVQVLLALPSLFLVR